eukprot:8564035-Pyramimonas_sp.AAC.1
MAEQVADQLDGVDLGPAAGPLRTLLQSLAADRANPPKVVKPPVAVDLPPPAPAAAGPKGKC